MGLTRSGRILITNDILTIIKEHKNEWLTAQGITELTTYNKHQVAWTLTRLHRDHLIGIRLSKTDKTKSRAYELRYEYIFIENDGKENKWLKMLGMKNG